MRRVRITLLSVGLLCGTLLALAGSSLSGASVLPAAGCYPGCSTTTAANPTTTAPGPTTTAPAAVAHTSSGSGDPSSATPSKVATQATGSLAFTGSDIVGLVVVALLLVGGGIVLVGISRRRSSLSN